MGDKVYLDLRFLPSDRPSKKLASQRLGPLTVSRVVVPGRAYKLDLPKWLQDKGVHDVFHAWLLHEFKGGDPLPG